MCDVWIKVGRVRGLQAMTVAAPDGVCVLEARQMTANVENGFFCFVLINLLRQERQSRTYDIYMEYYINSSKDN